MLFFSPDYFVSSLRSCAVEILIARCSGHKIEAKSGTELSGNA